MMNEILEYFKQLKTVPLSMLFGQNNFKKAFSLTAPLILITLVKIAVVTEISAFAFIAAFVFLTLGLITWSLVEYFIQKNILLYHRDHCRILKMIKGQKFEPHIISALDWIVKHGLYSFYLFYFLVFAISFLLLNAWFATSFFMLGIIVGYLLTEYIFFAIHTKIYNSGHLQKMQKFYFYRQKKNANSNFSLLSPYWDLYFNTIDNSYKTFEVSL
jgi:hypothetical protein